jgi:hypothetical protein
MFGRRTRTRLPTANKLLDATTTSGANTARAAAKAKQAVYFNRGAKEREPLGVGQTVRVKYDDRSPEWRKTEVAKVLPHRSYEVKFDDGTTRRRTSRHVRYSKEPPITLHESDDEMQPSQTPMTSSVIQPSPASAVPTVVTTRSGREVIKPACYRD